MPVKWPTRLGQESDLWTTASANSHNSFRAGQGWLCPIHGWRGSAADSFRCKGAHKGRFAVGRLRSCFMPRQTGYGVPVCHTIPPDPRLRFAFCELRLVCPTPSQGRWDRLRSSTPGKVARSVPPFLVFAGDFRPRDASEVGLFDSLGPPGATHLASQTSLPISEAGIASAALPTLVNPTEGVRRHRAIRALPRCSQNGEFFPQNGVVPTRVRT